MEENCEVVIEKKSSFGSLFKGLLIGGLIGAGAALLSAPRTGPETRQMLRYKGEELRGRAMDVAEDTRMRAEEITRKGTQKANQLVERGQEVVQEGKSRIESVATGIQEGVNTYREENASTSMRSGDEILPYDSPANPAAMEPPMDDEMQA